MIYLVCFFISFMFAREAGKAKTKTMFILFSILSLAPTILLAGLRDYSIGIDTMNYYDMPMYWRGAIRSNTLWDYLILHSLSRGPEVLAGLLFGCTAKLTGSYRVLLFLIHTIILTCIYIGAFRFRKYAAPEFILLLFYLFFYNHSLNVLRQYIAMSILFAAFMDIEQHKYKRFCFFVLIAVMFHSSAIIGLGPLILFCILYKHGKHLTSTLWRKMLVISGIIFIITLLYPLLLFLLHSGVLAGRYSFYLENETEAKALKVILLFLAMEIYAIYIFQKNMYRNKLYFDFYKYGSLIYFALYTLTAVIVFGKRIAMYFSLINVLTLSLLAESQKKYTDKTLAKVLVIFFSLVYWTFFYVIRQVSQTYPYKFGI